jgi:hypothetical protein
MSNLNWSKLTPFEFETLSYDLIYKEGFVNVKFFAGSGDRGRDIEAEYLVGFPEGVENIKYLIQCKRILSGKLSVSDLSGVKNWMDANQEDKRALIMTSTTVSPDTQDWLKGITPSVKYSLKIWDALELEQRASKHPEILKKYFHDTRIVTTVDVSSAQVEPGETATLGQMNFKTNGGEVIIAGGLTGQCSVSGSHSLITAVIDGKNLNSYSFPLGSLPTTQSIAWRTENLASGNHTIELQCSSEDNPLELVKSRLRIVELPPQNE